MIGRDDIDDVHAALSDPFLAPLAAAELDDEPYTDEQRAMAEAGRQEFLAGHTTPWEEVRRGLFRDEESAPEAGAN